MKTWENRRRQKDRLICKLKTQITILIRNGQKDTALILTSRLLKLV